MVSSHDATVSYVYHATVNQTVRLRCPGNEHSTLNVGWNLANHDYIPLQQLTHQQEETSPRALKRFKLKRNGDLKVSQLQLSDNGIYVCYDRSSGIASGKIHLNVSGKFRWEYLSC